MKKYLSFLSENVQFLEVKFSIYLNRRVFVMVVTRVHCRRIYNKIPMTQTLMARLL